MMKNVNINKSLLSLMVGLLFLANANANVSETNQSQNIKSSSNVSKHFLKEGKYFYSTYREDPKLGTGIGENYIITISQLGCKIDIDGYQADSHFACEIRNTPKKNIIEIMDKTDSATFGYIKKNAQGNYFLRITYYDNYNGKPDPHFYFLEKIK